MLNAQETTSTAAALLAPGTKPNTPEQFDTAWDLLTLKIGGVKTPKGDIGVQSVFDAYNAWYDLRWLTPRADDAKPYTPSRERLAKEGALYESKRALVDRMVAQYPAKVIVEGKKKTAIVQQMPEEHITGTVPWWYWPLRIGGGISAGLVIYRLLRPRGASPLSEFAADLYNAEGLSYERWLRAARHDGEYYGLSRAHRNKLREAWKRGEDPSEWIGHQHDYESEWNKHQRTAARSSARIAEDRYARRGRIR